MTNVSAAKRYDLHEAVVNTDLVQVTRLLQKGADINQLGPRRYGYGSALHLAVREGHLDIARLLIDWGAEVDVLDTRDFTPLHNAAWNGNLEMTKLLLDSGADINASTYDGDTPLKLAQHNGQAQVAEFILVKLQAAPVVDTKVEAVAVNDPGVVDISGTYIAELSGDGSRKVENAILSGAKPEDKPVFVMVQNGDQLRITIGDGKGVNGQIYGVIEGGTVKLRWVLAKGTFNIKPGGNEITGTVMHTGSGYGLSGNLKLTLRKIQAEPAKVVDISGTYIAETTASGYGPTHFIKSTFKNMNGKLIVLKQTGNTITGSVGSKSNWIKGTREGNIINFYILTGNEIIGSWEINADATNLEGKWFTDGGGGASGIWNRTRIE